MSTPRLIELNRRLDTKLNEFALTADASGQYPWQAAQQQKQQQRRRVGGALVGAAAIGAGAYGAKKLNARYGTQGMDGMKVGAADLVNRADDAIKGGMAKAKTAMAPMMGKAKGYAGQAKTAITAGATRAGAYGSKILKAGQQGYKQGGLKGMGSMAMRALRKVRFNRAEVLVELEAHLDGALQEFGLGTVGAVVGGAHAAMKKKEGETTPEYLARTTKGAVKGAVIGTGVKLGSAAAGVGLMMGSRKARVVLGRAGYRDAALKAGKAARKIQRGRAA